MIERPRERPGNPRFSSGPCAKRPGFRLDGLLGAPLGRSHRSDIGREKLRAALDQSREILGIPDSHRIAILPGSDTGAFEAAMWNLLGPRPVEVLVWDEFGARWAEDAAQQLGLEPEIRRVPYGDIVDLAAVDWDCDVCFTWNGTAAGVRIPENTEIPAGRGGLALCDATSAAFAMDLPWDRLDAVTFSWQKVLGGEAAHGVLVLSPRAVARLESHRPRWPVPRLFRLARDGRLIDAIFRDETINTPSMLCVEDYLQALSWARELGGLPGLIARAEGNARSVWEFCESRDWIENLARDPATRSTTSVCLRLVDARIRDSRAFVQDLTARLESEGVAFDVGAYRHAPPGLRIWCGATVEKADVEALLPWIEWAYESEIAALT